MGSRFYANRLGNASLYTQVIGGKGDTYFKAVGSRDLQSTWCVKDPDDWERLTGMLVLLSISYRITYQNVKKT